MTEAICSGLPDIDMAISPSLGLLNTDIVECGLNFGVTIADIGVSMARAGVWGIYKNRHIGLFRSSSMLRAL